MKKLLTIIIIAALAVGCASPRTLTRAELEEVAIGEGVDAPIGVDGITVGEALDLDQQRHRQAILMFRQLAHESAYSVEPSLSPLRYPTVTVKYEGDPPEGIFDNEPMIQQYRALRRIEEDTVIYSADLTSMTLTLERLVDGEPYEYRELTSTVPYGYCLDFIEENLGEASKEPEGYILRKIVCSQDDLGIQF